MIPDFNCCFVCFQDCFALSFTVTRAHVLLFTLFTQAFFFPVASTLKRLKSLLCSGAISATSAHVRGSTIPWGFGKYHPLHYHAAVGLSRPRTEDNTTAPPPDVSFSPSVQLFCPQRLDPPPPVSRLLTPSHIYFSYTCHLVEPSIRHGLCTWTKDYACTAVRCTRQPASSQRNTYPRATRT